MRTLGDLVIDICVIAAVILTCIAFSGCAALEPDVSLDAVHVSHASQHFGPNPTNYGYDSAQLALHWRVKRFELTVADGVVLEPCHPVAGNPECGALVGPREVFEARASYFIWQHH
jgi:hypothetical protein